MMIAELEVPSNASIALGRIDASWHHMCQSERPAARVLGSQGNGPEAVRKVSD
jgi:hypothetical protein